MKKKIEKVIKITLICLLFVNIFGIYNNKIYADGLGDVSENLSYWEPDTQTGNNGLDDIAAIIASIVRVIGILVSVGTLMVIGIKYMLGSVEEKAQYKQRMTPWIIGAIMVFAMTNIPTILYEASKGLFN